MIIRFPHKFSEFSEKRKVSFKKTLAANAGSSEIYALPVGANKMAMVHGYLRACAGLQGPTISGTVDATANTFTAGSAHGYAGTVIPGFVSATALPAGWSANTLYYAAIINTTTLKLYNTLANAITNDGATGLIDPTTAGTAVKFTPTVIHSVYRLFGAVANRVGSGGKCALVGSASVVSAEDVSGWDATIAADDTNKTLQIKATPDTDMDTRYELYLDVFEESLDT